MKKWTNAENWLFPISWKQRIQILPSVDLSILFYNLNPADSRFPPWLCDARYAGLKNLLMHFCFIYRKALFLNLLLRFANFQTGTRYAV